MATAKKTAAKATKKSASGADVDDILDTKKAPAKKAPAKKGGKDDDILEGKGGGKKGGGKKAPAKKARETTGVSSEDVKAHVGKLKKLTSYADIAEATGADLRMVRRTCRAMRDAGEAEIVKEGTACFVKKA